MQLGANGRVSWFFATAVPGDLSDEPKRTGSYSRRRYLDFPLSS